MLTFIPGMLQKIAKYSGLWLADDAAKAEGAEQIPCLNESTAEVAGTDREINARNRFFKIR